MDAKLLLKFKSVVTKGGPGSGHHGHSGRPGKVGGSVAGILSQETSTGKFKKRNILHTGKNIGYIQYKKLGSRLHINEIFINKQHRRMGLATKALQQLQSITNTKQITYSTPTKEGKLLFESTKLKGILRDKQV